MQCGFCTPGMVMSCARAGRTQPRLHARRREGGGQRPPVPLRHLPERLQGHPAPRRRKPMRTSRSGRGRPSDERHQKPPTTERQHGRHLRHRRRRIAAGRRGGAGDEPPPLPPNAELQVIGKPCPRLDAVQKVTGKARYTFDVQLPGMLYARRVVSTVPHARIKSDRHLGGGAASRRARRARARAHAADRAAARPAQGEASALPDRALRRPADRRRRRRVAARRRSRGAARRGRVRAAAARHRRSRQAMQDDAPPCFPGPTEQPATAGGGGAPPGLPQQGNVRGPTPARCSACRAATSAQALARGRRRRRRASTARRCRRTCRWRRTASSRTGARTA